MGVYFGGNISLTQITQISQNGLRRKEFSQLVGIAECFQPDGTRECSDACFVRFVRSA